MQRPIGKYVATTFLFAITLQSNAHAADGPTKMLGMQSGQDAYSACANTEKPVGDEVTAAFVCLSWINGAVQGAIATKSLNEDKPEYCAPEVGGSTGQYADIFMKFLRDNPEKRHRPAIMLFHQAMAKAFPCTM